MQNIKCSGAETKNNCKILPQRQDKKSPSLSLQGKLFWVDLFFVCFAYWIRWWILEYKEWVNCIIPLITSSGALSSSDLHRGLRGRDVSLNTSVAKRTGRDRKLFSPTVLAVVYLILALSPKPSNLVETGRTECIRSEVLILWFKTNASFWLRKEYCIYNTWFS